MKKILTVIGARPQFVKAISMSREICKENSIKEVVVHTGQHYDYNMSKIFFDDLEMNAPDYQLSIKGTTHGEMTAEMIVGLEQIILNEKPDVVMVYGDTNSTAAGAIAASKLGIPIAHIEAGLRSFLKNQPEEINRRVTDHLSTFLFCPTTTAVENLKNEGISQGVYHVGDVMYDVALMAQEKSKLTSNIMESLALTPKQYQVATVHRAENTDSKEQLEKIASFLKQQANDAPIIFPIHPRTAKMISHFSIDLGGIKTIPPLGYLDMAQLLSNAECIYTDSGGMQKEAYFFRVPCVTLREKTEWVETVEAGWNRLWINPSYKEPRKEINQYGTGTAARSILNIISSNI